MRLKPMKSVRNSEGIQGHLNQASHLVEIYRDSWRYSLHSCIEEKPSVLHRKYCSLSFTAVGTQQRGEIPGYMTQD